MLLESTRPRQRTRSLFRTYLVPLDGSELAERALPYAVKLASATGGRLVLMRAAQPVSAPARQVQAIRAAEQYLGDIAARIDGRVLVDTATPYAPAASAMLWEIDIRNADCIVMATHDRTGLSHLVYGSVAEEVVRQSRVPVLLVRATSIADAEPVFEPSTGTVLVALDGSPFAEAALMVALEIVGTNSRVVLTRAVGPPEGPLVDERGRVRVYVDQREEALAVDAADYLQRIATRLRDRFPDIDVAVDVRVGDAAEEIAAAERHYAATLTVMATHGRTGVGRMLMGSVAGEVLRKGATPVLLVSPRVTSVAPDRPFGTDLPFVDLAAV